MNKLLLYDLAKKYLGVKEIPGSKANTQIVEFLEATDTDHAMAASDETPWCSAFVNYIVQAAGYRGTRSAMARSWLKWGKSILEEIQAGGFAIPQGAIVIFWRDDPKSGQGHVAFYDSDDGDEGTRVRVLGGNQCDGVSFGWFDWERVLDVRVPKDWAPESAPKSMPAPAPAPEGFNFWGSVFKAVKKVFKKAA